VLVLFHEESFAQDNRNFVGLLIKDRAAPSSTARFLLRSPTVRCHVALYETGDDSIAGSEELDFAKVSILSGLMVYIVKLVKPPTGLGTAAGFSSFEFTKGYRMPRFNKILCPVDFDPNSTLALRLASELAQERQATLHLLHVVAPPGPEVALPFGKMETAARSRLERSHARQSMVKPVTKSKS
jgi:Universal stress protein family